MSLYSRLDRIAADVARLDRQLTAVSNHPQSQRTSVEGGSIDFNDDDGNLMAIVGSQDDGGNTINVISGPTPPTPVGFTVDVDHGKFIVHWSGDFDGDALAPSDWSRAEVHASQDPFFVPSRATARGSIVSAAGGEVTIGVLKGPWTIKMLTWSQAGKMSVPSAPVDVEVPGYGDIVLEEIDAATTLIKNAGEILVDGQETLGTKLDEADTALASLRESLDNLDETTLPALRQDLDAAEGRLSTAEGQITDAFGQLDAVPGQISNARQEAIDAALAEIDSVEGGLTSTIDKKITWSLDAPPVVFDGPKDATWFRVSSFGSGGQVVSQWRWNGTLWVSTVMSESVLAKINIGTGTFGNMSGSRLDVGSVTSDKVLVGAGRNIIPWSQVLAGQTVSPHVNSDYYGTGTVAVSGADATRGVPAHLKHTRTTSDPGVDRYVLQFYPAPFTGGASNRFAVQKGTWTLQVSAYTDVANLDAKVALIWYAADLSYGAASTSAPVRLGTQPKKLSVSIDLPDAAAYIMPYIRTNQPGETHWVNPELAQAVGGTLIEPGGIKTPHLAADVLEVGNLKAGAGAIAEVVSQKIAAAVGQFLELDVGQLTVTGTSKLAAVVAEQIAADVGEYVKLSVGQLVAGEGVMDEAVIQKLFTDVVVAGISQAQEFIGENALLTNSVTAPKIVASEELWAKLAQFVTVYAEMVDADVFNGRVFRGSTFLTTNESSWSDRGMFLLDDEGNPRIQAPTDGSDFTVNAEIVAKSLTAAGRASFLAENNRLEPGAGLVLAAGVGDPPSPPVVSNHYKQITPPPLVDGESVSGLAYGDGLFWRAVDAGDGNNDLDRIEGIDRAGVVQRTIPLSLFWARNGLAVIGDELFALGTRDDRPANVRNQERWVRVYGLDGTYKRQWEYPNYGTGTYQPGIGSTPAGNVSIAQCWQDGKLSWRTFSPTGSLINTTTRDAPVKSDAVGIYGGPADFGTTRTVFAKGFTPGTNRQFTVYGTNGNDYFPEQSWYSPGRGDVKGLAWDGEKFYSIDPAGVITEYGSLNMGDDSANWWATYRWVGSGGKTTRIAPPARFAWARRSRLRVSAPNLPQGVTTIEPSLAFKTTAPVRTEFRSPAWVAGATPATVNYEVLPTSWQSGAAPGDINNFPNSTPSSVKASTGLFEVKGDGSGRWGPLTFNPDGTMSSSAVPAWVPITAFASGFSVQSWGFAPAYRVWPDGKVEWRGVVAGNFSGTGTPTPFVIPSAARPSQPVNTIAGCNIANGGSEGHIRVEFSAADRPTQLSVYPAGKARSWFALDNITYYKS